ncbi:3-oxoacyl-[acyl-carrier-protein] synthase III C-terminal domain-containing protein [Paenibacillus sp.]|jgi:3-oxoacyl-[acyl-carrier-protein] synthase-3|uniref:3-oxoacyl-[acyl-carrier-protein] synthase III C-terminal domain-containing protein n=1 Tax=Paenibacillus sp. TaxID=58172 RepID=UPI00282FA90B|nr:3-oxoacyl-[acyl-carrier-protein] synthase III C-terminal domain-containing protein [Paenibacillus sp.]MDR0267472.1 hypothetical protein [Paenibacillus sp.]
MNLVSMPYLSVYLPQTCVSVEEVAGDIRASGYPFPDEDITYLREIHHFDQVTIERKLRLEEMIEQACAPLFERLEQTGNRVDKVIYAHTSQVYRHDQNMFRALQHRFHLENVKFSSISQQNCASIHIALRVAQNLFAADEKTEGIIIVTADKAFHPLMRRIPDSLLGDSAGACYLKRGDGPHKILFTYNMADGVTYEGTDSHPDDIEWFNTTYYFAIRQCITRTLRKASLKLSDLKLIVGSNANRSTWIKVSELLNCPVDLFYLSTIPQVGHLYCTDIIYNIQQAVTEERLKPGDLYLTVTVGLGGTYGCSIHEY